MTEEQGDKAYGLGFSACADDKKLTTNPYTSDSEEYKEWQAGWKHYDADYNPEYYTYSVMKAFMN